MPHPERFMRGRDHYDPDWTNGDEDGWGSGYDFFLSLYESIIADDAD